MATQNLIFDDGLMRLNINDNGLLVFNPTDMNVYERFIALARELPELEKQYAADVEHPSEEGDDMELVGKELTRAKEIDALIKRRLNEVFGGENDFDKLVGGVNLMAFGSNGERVITNLLNVLTPYVEEGVKKHSDALASKVARNRAERRAAGKKK